MLNRTERRPPRTGFEFRDGRTRQRGANQIFLGQAPRKAERAMVGGPIGAVVGGLIGGVVGAWWGSNKGEEIATTAYGAVQAYGQRTAIQALVDKATAPGFHVSTPGESGQEADSAAPDSWDWGLPGGSSDDSRDADHSHDEGSASAGSDGGNTSGEAGGSTGGSDSGTTGGGSGEGDVSHENGSGSSGNAGGSSSDDADGGSAGGSGSGDNGGSDVSRDSGSSPEGDGGFDWSIPEPQPLAA